MTKLRNVRYRQWWSYLNQQNNSFGPRRAPQLAWCRGRWWPESPGKTTSRLHAKRRIKGSR